MGVQRDGVAFSRFAVTAAAETITTASAAAATAARGVADGGRRGQDPRTFENCGDDPKKFGYFSIFFLKRIIFAFSNIFKIK